MRWLQGVLASDRGLGHYRPGQINQALAAVQVFLVLQGSSRGMDYVLPRPDGVPLSDALAFVEQSGSLSVWGWIYMAGAGAVFTGLFGGWHRPIWVGHGVLFAVYVAFGWGLLRTAPAVQTAGAIVSGAVLATGLLLGMTRWRTYNWVRWGLAMLLTGVGGWTTGYFLGYDFRSATGLLVAAGAHFALGFGLAWLTEKTRPHPLVDLLAARISQLRWQLARGDRDLRRRFRGR